MTAIAGVDTGLWRRCHDFARARGTAPALATLLAALPCGASVFGPGGCAVLPAGEGTAGTTVLREPDPSGGPVVREPDLPAGPVVLAAELPAGAVVRVADLPAGPVVREADLPAGPVVREPDLPAGPVVLAADLPAGAVVRVAELPGGPVVLVRGAPGPAEPVLVVGALWLRLGLSQYLLDRCLEHLGERYTGAETLLRQQLVQGALAEAVTVLLQVRAELAVTDVPGAGAVSRLHTRITEADRGLLRLLGASGFLAGGPGEVADIAELLAGAFSGETP